MLRYDRDTGAVDWQVRFSDGPRQIVSIYGMSMQPDGSPVIGGQVDIGPETGDRRPRGAVLRRHGPRRRRGRQYYAAWLTAANQLWLGKFTTDGDAVWTATAGDPQLAGVYPRGLGVTPQGKLVVVGARIVNNSEDAFYGVLDGAGELLWSETVIGRFGGADRFEDVAIDSRGLALIIGFRVEKGGQLGTYEAFVRLFAP